MLSICFLRNFYFLLMFLTGADFKNNHIAFCLYTNQPASFCSAPLDCIAMPVFPLPIENHLVIAINPSVANVTDDNSLQSADDVPYCL